MAMISREVIAGKLGDVAMRALESGFELASVRRDGYVEPHHWLLQILHQPDSDLVRILGAFGIDPGRVGKDLTAALDRQRRGGSDRVNFSSHLDLMIERGWIAASLVFGATRIRTGHLLYGMLDEAELRRLLHDLSGEFRRLKTEALAESFAGMTAGSPEEAAAPPAEAAEAPGTPSAGGGTKALDKYATDLTADARAGKLDPVLGRDDEIRQMVDILMRRRQNNPILTGEAGVGKTAVVEGLALRIAKGDVPPTLKDVRLMALDIGRMQAGASVKGEFENRLKQLIDEVQASPKPVILFVDEAHTLIGAGGAAGTGDAANLIKPALARGTLRTIAATTWAEYKRHIEKDPALTRRFQVVQVDEPDEAKAVLMLRGVASVLERHHKVQLLDEAVAAAVRLSRRYIQGRQLPDKAVSVLDTACARVAVSQSADPAGLEDCVRRIEALEAELEVVDSERRIGIDVDRRAAEIEAQLGQEREERTRLEARFAEEKELVDAILALRAKLRGAKGTAASPSTRRPTSRS